MSADKSLAEVQLPNVSSPEQFTVRLPQDMAREVRALAILESRNIMGQFRYLLSIGLEAERKRRERLRRGRK
jgi:hypothetical protein